MLLLGATESSRGQTESHIVKYGKCGVGPSTTLSQSLSLLESSASESESLVSERQGVD